MVIFGFIKQLEQSISNVVLKPASVTTLPSAACRAPLSTGTFPLTTDVVVIPVVLITKPPPPGPPYSVNTGTGPACVVAFPPRASA